MRCTLLLLWGTVACAGEFTALGVDASRLRGRAVGVNGESVTETIAYLVEGDRSIERVRTDATGAFAFDPAPGAYRVVLHDGRGLGHLVEAVVEDTGTTDLGELVVESLLRWPEAVLIRDIGYEYRLTDIEGGLDWIFIPEAGEAFPAYFRSSDERGGLGSLYRFDAADGALVRIHEDLYDGLFDDLRSCNERTLNAWLAVCVDLETGASVFRDIASGRERHRARRAHLVRSDRDVVWLLQSIEEGVDARDRVFDWRVARIDRDGTVTLGPATFGDRAHPRAVCFPHLSDSRIWSLLNEDGTCAVAPLYEIDLETLRSGAATLAEPLTPPPYWHPLDIGGEFYAARVDRENRPVVARWSPVTGELTPEPWLGCPDCASSERRPSSGWVETGWPIFRNPGFVFYGSTLDDASRFLIADVRAASTDAVGPERLVGGRSVELFAADRGPRALGPQASFTSSYALLFAPARTGGEEQVLLVEISEHGEVHEELLPYASVDNVWLSPSSRWLQFVEAQPFGNGAHFVREREDRGGRARRPVFDSRTYSRFFEEEKVWIHRALDPITGTLQLFRFEWPEDSR